MAYIGTAYIVIRLPCRTGAHRTEHISDGIYSYGVYIVMAYHVGQVLTELRVVQHLAPGTQQEKTKKY